MSHLYTPSWLPIEEEYLREYTKAIEGLAPDVDASIDKGVQRLTDAFHRHVQGPLHPPVATDLAGEVHQLYYDLQEEKPGIYGFTLKPGYAFRNGERGKLAIREDVAATNASHFVAILDEPEKVVHHHGVDLVMINPRTLFLPYEAMQSYMLLDVFEEKKPLLLR